VNTLLYVRTSLYGAQGASSQLAERFVAEWRARNPGGRVIERDLAADPVPHLTAERFQAFNTPAENRTSEQQAVVAYSDALACETGQSISDPSKLIAPMLARFMATDRAFAKRRRADQSPDVSEG